MTIDWITVAAQVLNFLVLVWLLKRFLYRPVMEAMRGREDRIRDRLDSARAREREAAKTIQRHREALDELRRRRDELFTAARKAAESRREALEEQARASVEQRRRQWQRELEREQHSFLDRLAGELSTAGVTLARRVLTEIADVKLEAQIVSEFGARLASLPKVQRQAFGQATSTLTLRTAFELHGNARREMENAVRHALHTDLELQFDTVPELICGANLIADGHKVGWSIRDYLDELEQHIRERLSQHDAAPGTDGAAPGAERRVDAAHDAGARKLPLPVRDE